MCIRDSIWTQNYTLAEITGILYKSSQPESGNGNGGMYAVSYTHLDVYKRQVIYISVSIADELMSYMPELSLDGMEEIQNRRKL